MNFQAIVSETLYSLINGLVCFNISTVYLTIIGVGLLFSLGGRVGRVLGNNTNGISYLHRLGLILHAFDPRLMLDPLS